MLGSSAKERVFVNSNLSTHSLVHNIGVYFLHCISLSIYAIYEINALLNFCFSNLTQANIDGENLCCLSIFGGGSRYIFLPKIINHLYINGPIWLFASHEDKYLCLLISTNHWQGKNLHNCSPSPLHYASSLPSRSPSQQKIPSLSPSPSLSYNDIYCNLRVQKC